MNIEGLDYNTQREKLIMPEYGREVQSMIDYAVTLEDRDERQRCANAIVAIMERMFPQVAGTADFEHKLWDHLAIMSGFRLDIDYPCDISQAGKIAEKPSPVEYPMKKIPVKHYGYMMFELFDKLKTMEDGPERDELIRITANQMKRNLRQWSNGSADDEKVASDLAAYTGGRVQLDLDTFEFEKMEVKDTERKRKRR